MNLDYLLLHVARMGPAGAGTDTFAPVNTHAFYAAACGLRRLKLRGLIVRDDLHGRWIATRRGGQAILTDWASKELG